MNSKLLLTLLIGIFLISFASAYADYGAVKTFIPSDALHDMPIGSEIDLHSGLLHLMPLPEFLGGGTLENLMLSDNSNQCLIDCNADIDVALNQDDTPIIDSIKFIDRKGNEVDIPHKITISYEKDVETPNIVSQCETTGQYPNGSEIKSCQDIQDGTITQTQTITENYVLGTKMPSGNYHVVIDGTKPRDMAIDWQITVQGVSLGQEWAWWDSSWFYKQALYATNITDESIGNVAINISINLTSLMASSKVQTDCDDIRFVNSSESGTIAYNITECSQTTNSTFIVYPTDAEVNASSGITMYMYYGNPSATLGASSLIPKMFENYISAGTGQTDTTTYAITYQTFFINSTGANNSQILENVAIYACAGGGATTQRITLYNATGKGGAATCDATWVNRLATTTFTNTIFPACPTYGWKNFTLPRVILYRGAEYCVAINGSQGSGNYIGWRESNPGSYSGGRGDEGAGIDTVFMINAYPTTNFTNTFGSEQQVIALSTTQSIPSNGVNLTLNNVTFGCNYTALFQNISIVNLTVVNGTQIIYKNGTKLTTANYSLNTTWTATNMLDGTYNWSCDGYGDKGINDSSSNRTFNLDATLPTVTVTFPDTIDYLLPGTNTTLNYSIIDVHNQTCWYNYSAYAGGASQKINCDGTFVPLNITYGKNNLTVYANDSFGNLNSKYILWNYTVVETAVYYQSPVITTVNNLYMLNITLNNTNILSANLSLNNTLYTSSITTVDASHFILSNNENAPIVGSDANVSLFWIVYLANGKNITTAKHNQTVNTISIDNCTVNPVLLLNYTLYDQDRQTILNASVQGNTTLEVIAEISPYGSNFEENMIFKYNQSILNVNPVSICIRADVLNTSNFRLDTEAKAYAAAHVEQYYNIQNMTVSNNTIPILTNVYDLATATSQEFKINLKDENFLPFSDVLINIARQYIPNGQYISVEVPKTDIDGSTLGHFILGDVYYLLTIYHEGVLLKSFKHIQPTCTNVATGDCTINLNLFNDAGAPTDFNTSKGMAYNLQYNETSNIWYTTFSTLDGSTKSVLLNVTLFDGYGNTTVCSSSVLTSSGSLQCAVPASFIRSNATTIATLTANGASIAQGFVTIKQTAQAIFGNTGILLTVFMYMTLTLLLLSSPAMMLVGGMAGLAMAAILNIYEGGSLFGIGSTILYLVIAAGIVLWKLTRKTE